MNTTHVCGGTILVGGSGDLEIQYCDRCGAFTHDMEADLPDGTDADANEQAWSDGDEQSPDAVGHITADHIIAEFAELGIAAYWEYPGYVSAVDATGRILCIGRANGPWGVDVYASEADAVLGVPATSDELPEANVRLLVNHALVVANRVGRS